MAFTDSTVTLTDTEVFYIQLVHGQLDLEFLFVSRISAKSEGMILFSSDLPKGEKNVWLVQWKEIECMCLTKGQNISASLSMFPVDTLAKGDCIFL